MLRCLAILLDLVATGLQPPSIHDIAGGLDHSWFRNLPSPWLAFYSLTFVVGGAYLAFVAAAENTVLRGATVAAAIYCIVVGVLLWIRPRFSLKAYVPTGVAFIA